MLARKVYRKPETCIIIINERRYPIVFSKIHYWMPNMTENDVVMIFYDLLMSDVVKCA